ncbi:hypothetical protein E1B28_012996 [Marasmius oreades]|uniref:F-box domain-containing protein n=1 Tax=Marasmius oreades TaxID=181124 RepID=A0A9P7UM67_9AGAR|nr:uncharacterized protein E1B28_012996 [Marasmius oreades]KAG7087018.1 hypothetical protein E1B28_012996 [Marasmius oreades]
MTTIESLPAENIAQIFKAASQLEFRQDNLSLPLTFLQCSKVSRRWYYIALQNPDLFTNIVIPFTALREQKYSISKWTKFWLEQSKTCTVTVTVRFDLTTAQARDLTIFRALLRGHIIPHASRLRAFRFVCLQRGISVSTQHFFDTPFILPVEAPNLEELVIRTGGGGILPLFVEPPGTKPLFMSSHKLRRLVIHGTAEIMFASLTGLTEFDASLVAISDTSFRKLVLGCPKLEILALRALSLAKPTPEGDSAPISMDFLRSLTLDFIASNVVNIFTHILAPNLEYLEVSAGGRAIRLVNALPVASSLTKLRKLKLVGVTSRQSADTGVVDDSQWFRDLPSDSIEEIHLAHTSGELLGIEFPKVPSARLS